MRNIPVFTAEHGLASLILREIPYSGRAYVLLRSVWNGQTQALLDECRGFCRMTGAEEVYASWDLAALPAAHAYDVLELQIAKANLPPLETPVDLEPLTGANLEEYREVYNRAFRPIAGATAYDRSDVRRLLGRDLAFLVRRNGVCVAVAERSDRGLAGVAVLPEAKGLGYPLTLTVLHQVDAPELRLRVSSDNRRALDLYRRIGFGNDTITSRWWKLLGV